MAETDLKRETPYFEIDKTMLERGLNLMKAALEKNWNHYLIGYSYKTNALPWVISFFRDKGCCAEVVSESEYRLGQLIGVEKSGFIYNGPIKTKASFQQALIDGCIVNIDSQQEIEWLKELRDYKGRIGLRVNYDIERDCPGQSQCGSEGGRFGFCYENGELEKALCAVQESGHRIDGLHLHVSSKTRSVDIYRSICRVSCEIARRFNLELSFIDIGGGFFGGLPGKPSFDEYFKACAEILGGTFTPEKTALIVEPGMALIGPPIRYVSSVIDIKDTQYGRFVVTDGSRTGIDPLMKKRSYYWNRIGVSDRRIMDKQVICGYTCMEADRLFTAVDTEEFLIGDKIVYDKVGAYTMCLSPLFIQYFPAVYVKDGNEITLVRHPWTAEMYIQGSVE